MDAFPHAPPGLFEYDGNKPPPHGYGINPGDPQRPGIVGYWPIDEGAGSQVRDESGFGNTGTLNGATWAVGERGPVLSFVAASANRITTPLFIDGPITIVLQIKISSFVTSQFIIGQKETFSSGIWNIRCNDGAAKTLRWQRDYGSGDMSRTTPALEENRWYDLALTWDGIRGGAGGLAGFFVDGVGSITSGGGGADRTNIGGTVKIGGLVTMSSLAMQIGKVAIYSTTPTPSEIQDLHDFPNRLITPPSPVLSVVGEAAVGQAPQLVNGGLINRSLVNSGLVA